METVKVKVFSEMDAESVHGLENQVNQWLKSNYKTIGGCIEEIVERQVSISPPVNGRSSVVITVWYTPTESSLARENMPRESTLLYSSPFDQQEF